MDRNQDVIARLCGETGASVTGTRLGVCVLPGVLFGVRVGVRDAVRGGVAFAAAAVADCR